MARGRSANLAIPLFLDSIACVTVILSVVLHRECSSSREIAVTKEIRDSPDVMREFFGKGKGRTYQTSDALPSRIIETFGGVPR
jgi:hypothetical protein